MKQKLNISEEKQDELTKLVRKYKSYKVEHYRVRARNKLYEELRVWMLIWMKSILSSWHKWEDKDELLSLSWDAFCFCLQYYNNLDVPLPKHFFDYTKYFLLKKYAEKESVELSMDELKETLSLIPSDINGTFVNLLTINQYIQESVPKKHKAIFCDALHSISNNHMERVWGWKSGCGVSQKTYEQLKKAYRGIILYLLKK